ncbi:hypothetical protein BCR39DRAFT_41711 [Naematelia encephala]|uniref:Fe2OG dioxygenase domain-containing protein n=1 Tax=Naematelia encephala TaxID=71784 RepID=A0A1Y2BBM4_9TREE|nr:hypothetical protein BCR39DRAFT_41711 [Naematelia encephala]
MPSLPDTTHTPFRLCEKHFKNRSLRGVYPTLHGRGVIDLSRPAKQEDDEVWRGGWWSAGMSEEELRRWRKGKGKARERGDREEVNVDELKRIELSDGKVGWVVSEGCIFIPQYLTTSEQLDLLDDCLSNYTLPPNPLSLSTHYALPSNLFTLYATDSTDLIQPLHIFRPPSVIPLPSSRRTVETEPGSVLGYDEIVARNKEWKGDEPSVKLGPKRADELMRDLRWANLGWVYQWSTKSYDFTPDDPIVFPPELAHMCTKVVKSVPWDLVFDQSVEEKQPDWSTWSDDYVPDTGIVNFYQMKDTLMGHVDRAELDPSRPLVSISLGHAAIFLLGSASRNQPPIPIILRSGDVLIMSGNGRQSYHGVPRIMEGTLPAHFQPNDGDEQNRKAAKKFIATARVNVNARQVFPLGFRRPDRHQDVVA